MMRQRLLLCGALFASQLAAASARADEPKWDYKKIDEVKKVEWKAVVQAGFLLNTGNSNTLSFSAGGMASRNDGKNRVTLEVGGAYAKSTVLQVSQSDADAATVSAGEVRRIEQNTTALWNVKLRYDRFLTPNNILYISGFAYGNEPAGKKVAAGAQAGYARQLLKTDMHLIVAELGIDYTFERLVAAGTPDLHVASLRAFLGYTLTLSKDTAFNADVEYLGNFNPLDGGAAYPNDAGVYVAGSRNIGAFQDTRILGHAALTTRLYKMISFRLGFTARFDNAPPPMSTIGGVPWATGYNPLAEKLDTITDASLIVTFL